MSDADYTTKTQPKYTENMAQLDELSTKRDNIKQMDPDPKDYFDLAIEYTHEIIEIKSEVNETYISLGYAVAVHQIVSMYRYNYKQKNIPRIGRYWKGVHDDLVSIGIYDYLNAALTNVQGNRRNKYENTNQEIKYARLHSQKEARAEIAALPFGLDREGTQNKNLEEVSLSNIKAEFYLCI